MRTRRQALGLATAVIGALLVVLGLVFLTVACEDLPGILGGTPGDSSPRTPLGVVVLVLGLAAVAVAFLVARRRPPSAS